MIVLTVSNAAELLGPLVRDRPEEWLAIAHLAADSEVLAVASRRGAAEMVELPLRDVFAEGLRLDSRSMILAHNHPSGDCSPSGSDIAITRRLAQTGEALGIRLCDHLIFGSGGYRSMRAMGLL